MGPTTEVQNSVYRRKNWFLRNLDGIICLVITTTFCTICETLLMEIIIFFNNAIIV